METITISLEEYIELLKYKLYSLKNDSSYDYSFDCNKLREKIEELENKL
jgi:hypothetical protein